MMIIKTLFVLLLGSTLAFAQEEVPVPSPSDAQSDSQIQPVNPEPAPAQAEVRAEPQVTPQVVPKTAPRVAPDPRLQWNKGVARPQQQQQQAPRRKVAKPKSVNPNDWNAFFTLGLTTSNSSSYTPTVAGVSGTATTDTGSAALILGGELNYRLGSFLMLGGALEWTQYKYSNNTGTATTQNDSHIGFFLLPKAYYEMELLTLWFGLGLGLERTSYGQTAANLSTSATGFAFSPRLGLDYEINESFLIGIQFDYTTFSADVSSTDATTKIGASRHWVSFAARIGTQF